MNPTTPTPTPPPAGGTKQEHTPTLFRESPNSFLIWAVVDGEPRIIGEVKDCFYGLDGVQRALDIAALIVDRVNGWTALAESERRLAETLERLLAASEGLDCMAEGPDFKCAREQATAALSARTP
jgi:hypothetical protein